MGWGAGRCIGVLQGEVLGCKGGLLGCTMVWGRGFGGGRGFGVQGGIEVLWQGGLGVQGFWGAVGGDLGLQRRFGVLPPTSPTLTMPGSSPEPLPLPLTGPITPPAPPTPPPAPQKKGLFTDDLHRLVDEWVQDTARAQVKGGAPLTPFLGCWGGPQYLNTSFPPPPKSHRGPRRGWPPSAAPG